MTKCNLPIPAGALRHESQPVCSLTPTLTWSPWLSQFNWVNWFGLAMFLLPVCLFYVLVHYWLLEHDLTLYHVSLYAQLGLLLMAFRQL